MVGNDFAENTKNGPESRFNLSAQAQKFWISMKKAFVVRSQWIWAFKQYWIKLPISTAVAGF